MTNDFAVLLVASRPPPVAGQSVATAMLLRRLTARGVPHGLVDLSRPFATERPLGAALSRAWDVARLPAQVLAQASELRPRPPIFYLQLGQSPRALLRDLPLLAIAALRGWPTVLHLHGAGFRATYDALPLPLRAAVRHAVGQAARAVVLSPRLASQFAGLVPPPRIAVVANGVESDVVAAARAHCRPAPRRGPLRVLFLSNLIASKGYGTVLAAARLSAARGLAHRFVLAGARTETTDPDPAAYIRMHGLTNVDFLGPVSGPARTRLLADADVFTLPTRYPVEGQPIAVLEAMHFGLPLITTRAGGLPDMVTAEENGLFVGPDDPTALLAAIDRLAADPALRLHQGLCNRATASAHHTEEAHGDAMVALFSAVAAEARRTAC